MSVDGDETRLRLARFEEAGHAVANAATARQFPEDRLDAICVAMEADHRVMAYVKTNEASDIFGYVMSRLQRGHVLSDTPESQRDAPVQRTRARTVICIAGPMACQRAEGKRFVATLQDYTYPAGWWERTQEKGEWRLRDRDKALLLGYFNAVGEKSAIALEAGSHYDRDVLLPVSKEYASSEAIHQAIDRYVSDAERDAEKLLEQWWEAVQAIEVALRSTPYLEWAAVADILQPFPDLLP